MQKRMQAQAAVQKGVPNKSALCSQSQLQTFKKEIYPQPGFLKILKVMENKETQRNCHRTEKTGETCQLNATRYFNGVLEQKKEQQKHW